MQVPASKVQEGQIMQGARVQEARIQGNRVVIALSDGSVLMRRPQAPVEVAS